MRRVRNTLGAMALVTLGAVGGLHSTSDAATGTWRFVSNRIRVENVASPGQVFVHAYNNTASPQTINYVIYRNGAVHDSGSFTVPANANGSISSPGTPGDWIVVFDAATSQLNLAIYYNLTTGGYFRSAGDEAFTLIGPRGTTNEAVVDALDRLDAMAGQVSAVQTDLGDVRSRVDTFQTDLGDLRARAGALQSGLDDLRSKVGNNTRAFCPEGSVRQDANGKLQTYVTLFSETDQTVRIDYITNKGTFGHDQALASGVRYTDDANQFLTGPAGPLAGQTDVDTSVRVTSPQPVFLACPVYFERQIGVLGQVEGGTVQDGNHN